MTEPNFILLHVASLPASAVFYQSLLGQPPIETSPTFAMFALGSGVMLGLWAAQTVAPAATPPGGSELGFAVEDDATVVSLHTAWRDAGRTIVQPPTRMDFGLTFTAVDPDGHRLRVFAAAGE